jgi:hypothetical protein
MIKDDVEYKPKPEIIPVRQIKKKSITQISLINPFKQPKPIINTKI